MSVLKQATPVEPEGWDQPAYKEGASYPRDLLRYILRLELKQRDAIRTLETVIEGEVDLDDISAMVSGINDAGEVSRETIDSLIEDWRNV